MILRRLSQSLKKQIWTAITVDLLLRRPARESPST